MKQIFSILIVLSSVFVFSFQCEDVDPSEELLQGCIDASKIRPEAACYLLYDPVCGCDNKTYSNDCVANNSGVLSYTKGGCD